jgi:hypothetical protein
MERLSSIIRSINSIIKQQVKIWFLKAVIDRFLENKTLKRQIALNILTNLVDNLSFD